MRASVRVIGFGFTPVWMKKWCKCFLSQLLFDTQVKTALDTVFQKDEKNPAIRSLRFVPHTPSKFYLLSALFICSLDSNAYLKVNFYLRNQLDRPYHFHTLGPAVGS